MFSCLSFKITKQDWTTVTKNTSDGLRAFHIDTFVIIHKEKTPT